MGFPVDFRPDVFNDFDAACGCPHQKKSTDSVSFNSRIPDDHYAVVLDGCHCPVRSTNCSQKQRFCEG